MNKIRISLFKVAGLILLFLFYSEAVLADSPTVPPQSCKIKREVLESAIEDYKQNKVPAIKYQAYFMFCRSASPIIKKYIVDSDASLRAQVADLLCCKQTKRNLLLLISQIEAYPHNSHSARGARYRITNLATF